MKQDSKIADGVLCDVIHGVYQGAPPPSKFHTVSRCTCKCNLHIYAHGFLRRFLTKLTSAQK